MAKNAGVREIDLFELVRKSMQGNIIKEDKGVSTDEMNQTPDILNMILILSVLILCVQPFF